MTNRAVAFALMRGVRRQPTPATTAEFGEFLLAHKHELYAICESGELITLARHAPARVFALFIDEALYSLVPADVLGSLVTAMIGGGEAFWTLCTGAVLARLNAGIRHWISSHHHGLSSYASMVRVASSGRPLTMTNADVTLWHRTGTHPFHLQCYRFALWHKLPIATIDAIVGRLKECCHCDQDLRDVIIYFIAPQIILAIYGDVSVPFTCLFLRRRIIPLGLPFEEAFVPALLHFREHKIIDLHEEFPCLVRAWYAE